MAKLRIDVESGSVDVADAKLEHLGNTGVSTGAKIKSMESAAKSADKSFIKLQKGSLTQLSYQLQDVGVQAGMGTNGLMIMAQQGPQILSLLGPIGAVAGAVIAIGSAFALVTSKLGGTKDSIEDMIEKFDELSEAQKRFLRVQLAQKLAEQEEQYNKTAKEVARLSTLIEANKDASEQQGSTAAVLAKMNKKWADSWIEVTSAQDDAKSAMEKTQQQLADLDAGVLGHEDSIAKLNKSYNDLIDTYSSRLTGLTLGERAQAKEEAATKLGTEATQEQIDAVNNSIDAYYNQKDAIEAATKAARDKADADAKAKAEQEKSDAAAKREQESINKSVEAIRQSYRTQREIVSEALDERNALIEASTVSEQEKQDLLLASWSQYYDEVGELDAQSAAQRKANAEAQVAAQKAATQKQLATLSYLTSASAQMLGEGSDVYKAFAITQATISTYTAAIEAYKSAAAIPVVGPYLAPAAAAAATAFGLGQIAQIKAARAQGGSVDAGSSYVVGERGREVFTPTSNGIITPADKSGGSAGSVQNNVYNYGAQVETKQNDTGGLDVYVRVDQLDSMMARHGANPNSKYNRSRSSAGYSNRRS